MLKNIAAVLLMQGADRERRAALLRKKGEA
jgi:hypothetical protein